MSLDSIPLHFFVFPCSEKKTREEIEEQQSTETENLNKGRLTVQFVLLRLQLKSQYSLVYMRGDSFGKVQQGHTKNRAIKQGSKVFLGSLFRNGHFLGYLDRELIKSTVKTVDWPYTYAKTW